MTTSDVLDGWAVGPFTAAGLTLFDAEPDVPAPDEAAALDDALELPEIPTDAGFPLTGSKSIAERKEELRLRNMELAKTLVDTTGWGHAKVQAELNRLAGITSVGSATNSELERRIRYGESWRRRR